jgi:hypothetical protein
VRIHQASTVILGTMNPSRPGSPTLNRPETPVPVAEYQDVRFGGSGGTNPARRFWTRLPVALRPRSNSIALVSPFISQGRTKRSKSGFDLVFSSKRSVVTEAKAGRALVVEVE